MALKTSILKLGYACNNNCLFCRVADKRNENLTTKEVFKKLNEIRRDVNSIILTGGEPTIRKDLIEIVRYAKNLGFKIIHIESNGRMFYYKNFVEKLIKNGVNSFGTALQSLKEETHNYLTSAKSFHQTLTGIENLKEFDVSVANNITITKLNYKELPDLTQFFVEKNINHIQLIFVQPTGNAKLNYKKIVPSFKEVEFFVHESLKVGREKNTKVTTEGIPLCFMYGYEDHMSEFLRSKTIATGPNFENKNFFEKNLSLFSENCKNCIYKMVCHGSWQEIINKEVKPRIGDLLKRNFVEGLPDRYYTDFIALKNNIKKLIRMMIGNETEYLLLEKFAKRFDLKIAHSDYKIITKDGIFFKEKIPFSTNYPYSSFFVYLSKDEETIHKAMEWEGKDIQFRKDRELGELLGYPKCCIKSYIETQNKRTHNFNIEAYISTKNEFNYLINSFLILTPFHLISHFPCSFECPESKKYAERILNVVKKENFLFSKEIETYLKLPMICFEHESNSNKVTSFVLFHGKINEDSIKYNYIIPFLKESFLHREPMLENLKKGDKIIISKNDKKIWEYEKTHEFDGILINWRCK